MVAGWLHGARQYERPREQHLANVFDEMRDWEQDESEARHGCRGHGRLHAAQARDCASRQGASLLGRRSSARPGGGGGGAAVSRRAVRLRAACHCVMLAPETCQTHAVPGSSHAKPASQPACADPAESVRPTRGWRQGGGGAGPGRPTQDWKSWEAWKVGTASSTAEASARRRQRGGVGCRACMCMYSVLLLRQPRAAAAALSLPAGGSCCFESLLPGLFRTAPAPNARLLFSGLRRLR